MKEHFNHIPEGVVTKIKNKLIRDETGYQGSKNNEECNSTWLHSLRTAHIARTLAKKENVCPTVPILGALFHDIGKFHNGCYHKDNIPEEVIAAEKVREVLISTSCEEMIPDVENSILSLYQTCVTESMSSKILYDADRLDKLGSFGIAQFFIKNSMRNRFLDEKTIISISRELTYAHHGPATMKTVAGKVLAISCKEKMFQFYRHLLDEWQEFGLGDFTLIEREIEGIQVTLISPILCSCGGSFDLSHRIKLRLKCRAIVATHRCTGCNRKHQISFCLPVLAKTTVEVDDVYTHSDAENHLFPEYDPIQ